METQQLLDLGKQMNLEEELRAFVRAEQALARDEIIRIREKKKEDEARIAAMEEAERIIGSTRRKMKRGLLRWKKQRGLGNMRKKYYVYK